MNYAAPIKKRPPTDVEGPIHRAILQWLGLQFRGAVIHHSPNETKWRSEKAMWVVQKAKANGTLSGFPDLLVIWRGHVMAFEVKAPKGQPSDNQKQIGASIIANGGFWAVVRSVEDAKSAVVKWGVLKCQP